MNPIVQAPDGTYVDLSKIVAISKIEQENSSTYYGKATKLSCNFKIYFTPLGIPFKQNGDIEFNIKIVSDNYSLSDNSTFAEYHYINNYSNPKNSEFASDEEEAKYNKRIEEAKKYCDTKREELVTLWKQYKDSEIKV